MADSADEHPLDPDVRKALEVHVPSPFISWPAPPCEAGTVWKIQQDGAVTSLGVAFTRRVNERRMTEMLDISNQPYLARWGKDVESDCVLDSV